MDRIQRTDHVQRHGKTGGWRRVRTLCKPGGRKCYGLTVEDNFSVGRSGKCETFDNEPLSTAEEFHILDLEVIGLEY